MIHRSCAIRLYCILLESFSDLDCGLASLLQSIIDNLEVLGQELFSDGFDHFDGNDGGVASRLESERITKLG